MLDSDLIQRIRTIFLQARSFVSIDDAAALLGWSRRQMREAITGQDVEVTTTAGSGKAIPHDELVALALDHWPIEWIEQALTTRAAGVLPEANRSRNVVLPLPRYQAAMLDYLAEQQQTTAGHLVSRVLDDLAAEHFDALATAIPGFADAVAWPHVHDTQQPC